MATLLILFPGCTDSFLFLPTPSLLSDDPPTLASDIAWSAVHIESVDTAAEEGGDGDGPLLHQPEFETSWLIIGNPFKSIKRSRCRDCAVVAQSEQYTNT